jgi:AmmeMemoRadiSam system protein A
VKTRGPILAAWARAHLRHALGGPQAERPVEPWAADLAATFVTLRWTNGELQGCIGSLAAVRSIADDVADHVVSAALHDPRSSPIAIDDIDNLDLEVSLLSPLEPIEFADEPSAKAAIRAGTDGLVFAAHGRRSTLLPIMWKQLPTVDSFVAALKQKAGLSTKFWSDDVKLWRYTTDRYEDPAPARLS